VARTGQPERFTGNVPGLGKWFSVYAFRVEAPERNRVAILVNDITEHRQIEEELRAASTLKDEFLGLVSHELRTPLTVIRGTASLLQRHEDLPAATHREIVADLVKESDRLRRVVENMLVLGRLQAGEKPPAEPLVLDRSIRQAVRRFLDIETVNRVRIGHLPEGAVVLGIQGYVEQIIQNFCSNAYKYSPPNTTVFISARVEQGYARVSVADRGRGLTTPEALFTPFYREPEIGPTTPGLGLGLAVTKRLVEAMGGTIRARPRRGGGSEFSFTLPIYADLTATTV
jgi:signal transduction histidine kinase